MSAMVSANSLAAEAIRMGDRIGSIAPGYDADIIALDARSSQRYHCGAARHFRDERRRRLQERRVRSDPDSEVGDTALRRPYHYADGCCINSIVVPSGSRT